MGIVPGFLPHALSCSLIASDLHCISRNLSTPTLVRLSLLHMLLLP